MPDADPLRELKRKVDELAMLNEIGKTLTSSLDISEVLRLILGQVSALLRPRNWSILLRDPATGELVFESAVGAGGDTLRGLRLRPGEGIAGWVADHARALKVDDVAQDPRFSARFDEASRFHTQSILCVPLVTRGTVLGVIELVNGAGDGPFSDADLRILSTVGEFAAIALENARNYARVQELTILDDHTGLYNSRHLRQILASEVVRATRFGHPVSLVFLDLDHFKAVNDAHGHSAGSQLLAEVGALLRKTLRVTDVPVRYGGDEFVLLLPETSKDQAIECARRLREEIRCWPFLAAQPFGPVRTSASFGIATFPDDAQQPDGLLQAADAAMYRVKRSSRDGVAAAEPAGAN